MNSRSDGQRTVVEPTLYTVEGRQTGDLRQKCDSALIRKRARDREEGVAF